MPVRKRIAPAPDLDEIADFLDRKFNPPASRQSKNALRRLMRLAEQAGAKSEREFTPSQPDPITAKPITPRIIPAVKLRHIVQVAFASMRTRNDVFQTLMRSYNSTFRDAGDPPLSTAAETRDMLARLVRGEPTPAGFGAAVTLRATHALIRAGNRPPTVTIDHPEDVWPLVEPQLLPLLRDYPAVADGLRRAALHARSCRELLQDALRRV